MAWRPLFVSAVALVWLVPAIAPGAMPETPVQVVTATIWRLGGATIRLWGVAPVAEDAAARQRAEAAIRTYLRVIGAFRCMPILEEKPGLRHHAACPAQPADAAGALWVICRTADRRGTDLATELVRAGWLADAPLSSCRAYALDMIEARRRGFGLWALEGGAAP